MKTESTELWDEILLFELLVLSSSARYPPG